MNTKKAFADMTDRKGSTMAQIFTSYTKGKYHFDLDKFTWSDGPKLWEKNPRYLVQYNIKFTDGSSVQAIMSNGQRFGIVNDRSTWTLFIDCIGGEGYKKLKPVN